MAPDWGYVENEETGHFPVYTVYVYYYYYPIILDKTVTATINKKDF